MIPKWYIWHFWSDEYEEIDVIKTTPTRVQLQDGNWSMKRTERHAIASSVEAIEMLRQEIARGRVLRCQEDLRNAQQAMDHAMLVALAPRETVA